MVDNLFSLFLPDNIKREGGDSEIYFRARIIIAVWLLGIIVPVLIFLFSANQSVFFIAILSIVPVTSFINIFLLKLNYVDFEKLGILSTLTFLVCLIIFIYHEGVIFSATSNWSALAIILAVFFVGKRFGFFVLFVTSAVIIHMNLTYRHQGLTLHASWSFEDWANNLMVDQVFTLVTVYVSLMFLIISRDKTFYNLIKAKETVSRSSRLSELGKVAGGIAHEINNPLSIISGNAQLIKKELSKDNIDHEKICNMAEKIEFTCSRAASIIQGLKNMTRDGSSDPFEKVSLEKLLKDVSEVFAEKVKTLEIDFSYKLSNENLFIYARYAQIYQVFINIINNAIDAIEEDNEKWIKIEVNSLEKSIEIAFIDSGKGIPSELEEKVLEPLFTTKELGKGTGLGLSIVNTLIQEHKGSLVIDRSFQDSRITISLPKSLPV